VDDNKIYHVDSKVVTKVINSIEKKLGKMSVIRGKDHVFLGINIKFRDDGTFIILMKDYLEESIEEFGEDIVESTTSPAQKSLFIVDPNSELLDKSRSKRFHSIIEKLFYVPNRARVDLKLVIVFLCTRVSKSTIQDWSKLKRVLLYIKCKLDMYMILGADSMLDLLTWVDVSYAVHDNMKNHTSGCMSFGVGILIPKSAKQKLNTKSTTESEIVGASDYIPNVIWAELFLKHQGIVLQKNDFDQDNPKCYEVGGEQKKIMWSRIQAHRHKILFYEEQVGCTAHQCSVFSNWKNVSRFLHEATAKKFVSKI